MNKINLLIVSMHLTMLGIGFAHDGNNGIRIQVETRFFYPQSADFF